MEGDSAASGHRNIRDRAIYYLCALHASQKGRGIDYANLMRSYQVMICGYAVFPGRDRFIRRYSHRDDETGELLSDATGIVFVELSKLGAAMKKPVSGMTPAEMWSVFLRYADNPKHRDLLSKITAARKEIKMASELLMNISQDERERARYLSRLKYEMDMEHNMAVIRREVQEGQEKQKKLQERQQKERAKWERIVADKDAALADKDARIAELLARLGE